MTTSISEELKKSLFITEDEKYGKDYNSLLLSQYKLYVEMADNISARRATANNFFLSINAFLVAAIGFFSSFGASTLLYFQLWLICTAVAGAAFSAVWYFTIKSYKTLNRMKFQVINAIEKKLPAAGYSAEWKVREKHRALSLRELYVPSIFFVLYISLTCLGLIAIFFPIG